MLKSRTDASVLPSPLIPTCGEDLAIIKSTPLYLECFQEQRSAMYEGQVSIWALKRSKSPDMLLVLRIV